jgi:hypothetical protein
MENARQQVDLARQFAAALDSCDYACAAQFLAGDCQYERPGKGTLVGPISICESYAESDRQARRRFASVEYRSEADHVGSDRVRLTFFDEVRLGNASHTFRCGQIVYFGGDQKIIRIELDEIPGEREQLNDFCSAWEIQRQ